MTERPLCPNGCGELSEYGECDDCGYEFARIAAASRALEACAAHIDNNDWAKAKKWALQARGYLVISSK